VRESVELIRAAGATPCGVVIALDRMERGLGDLSAAQEVEQMFHLPVMRIASLDDLVSYLSGQGEMARELQMVARYRTQYGAIPHAP
jgi:orotate phosphoribosyltransferase